jgi:hypothetical protein
MIEVFQRNLQNVAFGFIRNANQWNPSGFDVAAGLEPGDLDLGTLANQVFGEVIEVRLPFRLRQCSAHHGNHS